MTTEVSDEMLLLFKGYVQYASECKSTTYPSEYITPTPEEQTLQQIAQRMLQNVVLQIDRDKCKNWEAITSSKDIRSRLNMDSKIEKLMPPESVTSSLKATEEWTNTVKEWQEELEKEYQLYLRD